MFSSSITFYQVFLISALFLLKNVEVYLITPTFIIEPSFDVGVILHYSSESLDKTHKL